MVVVFAAVELVDNRFFGRAVDKYVGRMWAVSAVHGLSMYLSMDLRRLSINPRLLPFAPLPMLPVLHQLLMHA